MQDICWGQRFDNYLKAFQTLVEAMELAIEKSVLYGSRAKGNFMMGSDIDFTLYGKALTSDLHSIIASKLDDLLLPHTIDLSIFDKLDHAQLQEHIERVGVLFYEREG